ncbi:MAG: NADH-quinone oxidoreductase subunit NuoN [Rickettsiales bacterium]|nr:NADH-quinone oxidoreductase subunit NuoN [Rickettsiales bacterium]
MPTTNLLGDIVVASLSAIKPELFLGLTALILLVHGVYRQQRCNTGLVWIAVASLVFGVYLLINGMGANWTVMNTMLAASNYTALAKILVLVSTILVLLLSEAWLSEGEGKPFEFIILTLFSVIGMMLMISANDFLSVYMALELSSLALYVLASFSRDHAKSSEAGLKYFVLGALASGMMLFGISLIYGFTGSTGFETIKSLFSTPEAVASKGVVVGLVLVIIGFCFKLSAAPFHMWAPDVYEGAPTPVTAFFATAPKVAALALLVRILLEPFGALIDEWQQIIILVSILSMSVGALAAIMQTNIKRLLAYSSIGHAGFMLMGLAAGNQAGVQAILIYLALYIFMSAAAFGCVMLMKYDGHYVEDIKELRGLAQTRPLLALMLAAVMFSMAGIPPLAGFFGKFYIVMALVEAQLMWLAVVGVTISVISCYYYLKVVKVMYFDEPAKRFDVGIPCALRVSLLLSTVVTVLFFLVPSPLIQQAKAAAEVLVP